MILADNSVLEVLVTAENLPLAVYTTKGLSPVEGIISGCNFSVAGWSETVVYIYIFENTPPPRGWGKYPPMLFGGKIWMGKRKRGTMEEKKEERGKEKEKREKIAKNVIRSR
jgi:hypothetical protein